MFSDLEIDYYIVPAMSNSIFKILQQPYPDDDSVGEIVKTSVYTGLIVFLVLYSFRPFNLGYAGRIFTDSIGFGAISFVAVFVYQIFVKYVLGIKKDRETWHFWKWIVDTIILILFISLGNVLYANIAFDQDINFVSIIGMIRGTFLIAIFPILIFGWLRMSKSLSRYEKLAAKTKLHEGDPNTDIGSINVESAGKKLQIIPSQVLFVEAMQNYVILHLAEATDVEKITVRTTLKNTEESLLPFGIVKTHRSFLVNKNKIVSVSGNAQGLKLKLPHTSFEVPVSRKYIGLFRD